MENGILLVGRRKGRHHFIVTRGILSLEQLAGMNKNGWILSQMKQNVTNFHYDFIRLNHRGQLSG